MSTTIIYRIIFCLGLVLSGFRLSSAGAQTQFYVSPAGTDRNPGTSGKPFASLQRAVAQARQTRGPVTILLDSGRYALNQALVFKAADSRADDEPLIISSATVKPAELSGAALLKNLHWTRYANGIWQTKIEQDILFDQLVVNGEVQRMARYPNYDPKARFYGGTAEDAISAARAARWKSPEGAYVHALHEAEWGDFHYRITGKNAAGEPVLEGGWQNNRRMGMHPKYRFVENVFEELDAEQEWFYDAKKKILYYFPPKGVDLRTATFASPQLAHLIELKGSEKSPVRNIHFRGLALKHTTRTFMLNREPLLRSDWTIYRGGAVVFEGAVQCRIEQCDLRDLGGNGIFFNRYNRSCTVKGNRISGIGASAVCFVGDPGAVRSPNFEYHAFTPIGQIDRTPGPRTNTYPASCLVYDNLLYDLGQIEKQPAGLELSMCRNIRLSHNTIYDVPRAGINVSEGTWGGHIIEFNDVFNTVKESGDHGSFNSWGRDRYWQPDKKILDQVVEQDSSLAMLDVVEPIILRNNRMRCDHGWDIDLDDGSSHYRIYNNLCLNGGIKLREGVNRIVENNIIVNNTFHPHVWFRNSADVFRHNIVAAGYQPIGISRWGDEVDHNVFPDTVSLAEARTRGTDIHSIAADPGFVNPRAGDYRVTNPAVLAAGFRNFPMDSFGVVSPRLKALARSVELPEPVVYVQEAGAERMDFLGLTVKNLTSLGERSATGMADLRGVLILAVAENSRFSPFLQPNDVILAVNGKAVARVNDLPDEKQLSGATTQPEFKVFRNQHIQKIPTGPAHQKKTPENR